jgi:hypothetical protein
MRNIDQPRKVWIKNFGIRLVTLNPKTRVYLAIPKHHLPYTTLPEYIRRFETRHDAEKELWNKNEKVIDLRYYQ